MSVQLEEYLVQRRHFKLCIERTNKWMNKQKCLQHNLHCWALRTLGNSDRGVITPSRDFARGSCVSSGGKISGLWNQKDLHWNPAVPPTHHMSLASQYLVLSHSCPVRGQNNTTSLIRLVGRLEFGKVKCSRNTSNSYGNSFQRN